MLKINRDLEIALGALEAIRTAEKPVRVQDVATKIGAPRAFLDRVVWKLSRAGITRPHRGPGGGVSIAKDRVSVLELAQALGYKPEPYGTKAASSLQEKISNTLALLEAF